jgi:hypothetical protein
MRRHTEVNTMRTWFRQARTAGVAWLMLILPALALVIDGAKRW